LNVEVIFILCSGILLYVWISLNSVAGFFVWVAVYGFFAGGCQSLFQSASAKLSPHPGLIGIRIGMICTLVSFACLSGPPLAGKLIEGMNGDYLGAQIFGGTAVVSGSVLLFAAAWKSR